MTDGKTKGVPAWLVFGVFVLAVLVRTAFLEAPSVASGDEAMHSVSAVNYSERGYFGPDNWYSPPLKHLLLHASVRTFGDNVYGWRMRNILFGSATVALLFVMARRCRPEGAAAFLAASLLLLDPLHIAFSRSTFEDIPATFFLLAAAHCAVRAVSRDRRLDWPACGVMCGLAVSLRLYAAPAVMVLSAVALWSAGRQGQWGTGIRRVMDILFPCAFIYLLVYLPWFHRGYGLADWVRMQADAFRELRQMSHENFPMAGVFRELGRPATWFFRPTWVGFDLGAPEGHARVIAMMNNPPVWMLMPPAVLYALYRSVRSKEAAHFIPAILFVFLYGFFLAVDRPIFLYSGLVLLPFGFLALSGWVGALQARATWIALAAVTVWGLYLYPLAMGLEVPDGLYQYILRYFRMYASG